MDDDLLEVVQTEKKFLMDTFNLDFQTDSTLINEAVVNNNSHLDWTAFQSGPTNPLSSTWFAQHDDAVAPDYKSHLMPAPHDDGVYCEIERFFNSLNQEQQQQQQQQSIVEPVHVNIHIPDQTRYDLNCLELGHRLHLTSIISERPTTCLPAPLVPRLSSSRSQCYHKLPDHAVKLMQEWYNANLDNPYPRSPDKKRFITEGNITAQQCRSWFANRRQRLKHVKRNQPRASSSRSHHSLPIRSPEILTTTEDQSKLPDCYHLCPPPPPPQVTSSSSSSVPFPLPPTLNVVINQQTVEQLIHNSLRKLLYPL